MTVSLYKFQKEGVDQIEQFMAKEDGALLADSMGLGKTVQALTYIKNHPEMRPVLIVCPASIKYVWERQASEHLNLRVEVLGSTQPKDSKPFTNGIYVINYDVLHAWKDWLIEMKPALVVADECQFVVNRGARRTKCLRDIVAISGKFLAISGTPFTNRVSELWTVLNMLNPKRWPSFHRFTLQHTYRRRTPWGWDYSRPKRLAKLHKDLKKYVMIRRLKEDVLKDLPERTRNVVPINLKHRKEYDEAEKDFRSWVVTNFTHSQAARSLKSEAVTKVGHLKRLVAKLKLNQTAEWVQNFLDESEGKLILFCYHRSSVADLQSRFPNCAVVTGSVTGRARESQFRKFNTDKKCRVFLGNSASYAGWSATSCSDVAWFEYPWQPGNLQQGSDRTHGIGRGVKEKSCTTHLLIAKNTIEEKICRLLETKAKTLSMTLDGRKGGKGTDILNDLLKEMASGS